MFKKTNLALLVSSTLFFVGCVDINSQFKDPGSSPEPEAPVTVPEAVQASIEGKQAKVFAFSWSDVDGAEYYRLLENPDGISGFSPLIDNIQPGTETASISVPLFKRTDAEYIIESCNSAGCASSDALTTTEVISDAVGYFKTDNPLANDWAGYKTALSEDGSTIAFVDHWKNGGEVYVYKRTGELGDSWTHEVIANPASNADPGDEFGYEIALSYDGNTIAISAVEEDSGVPGDKLDDSASNSGAAYIYTFDGSNWTEAAYLKASNLNANDDFGTSIALSGNGQTLVVGAPSESSSSTSINTGEALNDSSRSGAAYVFQNNAGAWTQEAYLKAHNTGSNDTFGWDVTINFDGTSIVVGAPNEDNSGAFYEYSYDGSNWTLDAFVKASTPGSGEGFGYRVDISGDGNTLGVQAYGGGPSGEGRVYVFNNGTGSWVEEAILSAHNESSWDAFGHAIDLTHDGSMIAIGSEYEQGSGDGFNPNGFDDSGSDVGAAYLFEKKEGAWSEIMYLKHPYSDNYDYFGNYSVAISPDGTSVFIGAYGDDGNSSGFGGSPANNDLSESGAALLY